MRPDRRPAPGRRQRVTPGKGVSRRRWLGWALALLLVGGLAWALTHFLARRDKEGGWAVMDQPGSLDPQKRGPSSGPSTLARPGARKASPTNQVGAAAVAGQPGLAPTGAVSGATTNAPMSNEQQVDSLINEGARQLSEGNPSRAADLYAQALKINPDDETIHYNLAIAWGQLGRVEAAKKEYLEALRLFPEYSEAHVNLGNLLARQGQHAEALEHFNLALKANPESASAHNALGTALAKQKDYREALAHFLEATRLEPNYLEAHYNLGITYLSQGKSAQAIEKFREILRQQPDFQPAQAGLQRALRKQAAAPGGR